MEKEYETAESTHSVAAASLSGADLLTLTGKIVASYVSHNNVAMNQISEIVNIVHQSLQSLQNGNSVAMTATEASKPAISVKKSVTDDYIICLEDGKKLRMLKRHLRSTYDMSPEQYRAKWNLPSDYPMVAPSYARLRSDFAKKIGLGKGTIARRGRKAKKAA